jgi:hypothetical protein
MMKFAAAKNGESSDFDHSMRLSHVTTRPEAAHRWLPVEILIQQ